MAYEIKLYAHGVPYGQDIWGEPSDDDRRYIELLYGRQTSVPAQMLLEVMQLGGKKSSYYTYYQNRNIQDKEGRGGGYFALTIRINYYYADIQNIYNLLVAAFNKYIVGIILERTQTGYRFKVSQLSKESDCLGALESEIVNYLMKFSKDEDFVSLSSFKSNGQNRSTEINLSEANRHSVADHVKQNGKISVSPFYQSSEIQNIIYQVNREAQRTKDDAQRQIADITRRSEQELQSLKTIHESAINAIRQEYRDADNRIHRLNSKVEEANRKIQLLEYQISTKNQEIIKLHRDSRESNELHIKLKKLEITLSKIRNVLYEVDDPITKPGSFGGGDKKPDPFPPSDSTDPGRDRRRKKWWDKYLNYIIIVLTIACVAIFAVIMRKVLL